jgi:hypothetical protein
MVAKSIVTGVRGWLEVELLVAWVVRRLIEEVKGALYLEV